MFVPVQHGQIAPQFVGLVSVVHPPLVDVQQHDIVKTFDKAGVTTEYSRMASGILQLDCYRVRHDDEFRNVTRLAAHGRRVAAVVSHLEMVDGGLQVLSQRRFVSVAVLHGPV